MINYFWNLITKKNKIMLKVNLDAIETKNGNLFVVFHEYYGAYFKKDLSDFTENPVRVEADKEWEWACEHWNTEPIELSVDDSNKLIELVRKNKEHGLENIVEKVREEYGL